MRKASPWLAIVFLAGCHRSNGRDSASNRGGGTTVSTGGSLRHGKEQASGGFVPSPDGPSQDFAWSHDLATGVNGTIPLIVVDQFGYRPNTAKVAVIRDPQQGYDHTVHFVPGTRYAIVNKLTGAVVKEGLPIAWNNGATDSSSGDRAWWFDFSDVTQPGSYTVFDIDKHVRSVEFDIDDAVYRRVLKHAVRMFFYQRAGFEKTNTTAGSDWVDAASHLGAGQDPQSHSWLAKTDASRVKDLRGGWFDAGDLNKYTSLAARNAIVLLRAFEENPSAFGDNYEIAESGNGVPDILDEVKWGMDWLKRMQNADGSLLCVQGLAPGSPPSAAKGPSYYGPATTSASLMGAAAFAYAAKIYGARPEPVLKAYGADLATSAKKAWAWANANPKVLYWNNDDSRQPGSLGLASGQQEMNDSARLFAQLEAAVYLYELTGDATFRTFVEANYSSVISASSVSQWVADRQEALLYYAQLPGVAPSVHNDIAAQFTIGAMNSADQLPMITGNKDPYRAPMKDYVWGSNMSKATQARIYQLLAKHGDDTTVTAKAAAAAEEYVHYIHGVNPLGLVYLTNMQRVGAEHSAKTLFHTWFADGSPRWDEVTESTPGPPPGYLVGGPSREFSLDSCCTASFLTWAYHCNRSKAYALCKKNYTPPLGQPDQKAYLQFNSGWPAGSWPITEPSTGYQSQYVRVLAAYAR